MNETKINWTELTWNPASGCTKISAGCKHCYAESLAENKRGTPAFPVGFDVVEKPWKLDEPRKVKRASLIFTNSMTDMFHEKISDGYRESICEAMERYGHHRYQVLTKRPDAAAAFFASRPVPASVWLGASVEHAATVWRIDALRSIDARVRFLSCEPLIGAIGPIDLAGIHWVIGGGESGVHMAREHIAEERGMVRRAVKGWDVREDRKPWARELRDQCTAAGVAFWWKQWGGTKPGSAGRDFDGRTWDEMPSHAGAMPDGEYVHRDPRARRQLPLVTVPVISE
jgi:protein gp37